MPARSEAPAESAAQAARSNDPDLHLHAPLQAVIRFGKKAEERMIPVKLVVRLTEVGTLELWCVARDRSHRWKLELNIRERTD